VSTLHFTVPEEFQAALGPIAVTRSFPPGKLLFQKGDPVEGVYLIRRGRVSLALVDVPEAEPRVVGSGALLGLPSTLGCRPYSLTARALEPVEAGFIPHDAFMPLLKQHPALTLTLAQGLAWELTEMRHRASELLEEHFNSLVGSSL
jgi:CBS domain-containing protein